MATMSGRGGSSSYIAGVATGLFVAAVGTAQAQTAAVLPTGTAHVIEWDLSSLPDQLDGNPGAMVVDTRGEDGNRVWFITRFAAPAGSTAPGDITSPQKIYRFLPARSLYKAAANWSSWELRGDIFGGGITKMRPSHDRRFLFARTTSFIQRIDTQNCPATSSTCERTVFSYVEDAGAFANPLQMSDIAPDDYNRVFTTGIGTVVAPNGYLQMLDTTATPTADPAYNNQPTINAKRWPLDTAGICIETTAEPGLDVFCNSGVDVHPSKQNLVYVVQQVATNTLTGVTTPDTITEVDVSNLYPTAAHPNVRRWSLQQLDPAIAQPRTLKIDRRGRIWITTGSGHLVSLDPATNRMTEHQVPDKNQAGLWGIAPDDDVIGYTASNTNKVAMLFPKFNPVVVSPSYDAVSPMNVKVLVKKEAANRDSGTAPADAKVVVTDVAPCNGTCVEADVSKVIFTTNPGAAPSLTPLGISPNMSKAQGTFFYTVGLTAQAADPTDPNSQPFSVAKRLGFVRLPNKERIRFARDDDDADDGFDRTKDARWHNSEPGDADADGVPDQYDTNTTTDNMTIADLAVVPVGQSSDYPASTSATTLALIAAVTPDVPTATIAVDVYNSLGALVGTSGPIVGAGVATVPTPGAGTYKIRVRNLGTSAVTPTPAIVVREPLIQQ